MPLPLPLCNPLRESHIPSRVSPEGQRWKALSKAEKAKYKGDLTLLPASGRGGVRAWAPASVQCLPPATITITPSAPAPSGEQIISRPTARVLPSAFPGWSGTAGRAASPKKKRPAPADPTAWCARKEPFTSPYTVFCGEQRPLQPPDLSYQDREKSLGELAH